MKTKIFLYLSITITIIFLWSACKKNDDDNTAPIASISINSQTGTTDFIFVFDATGCYDNEDTKKVLQVRWDFDGDGNWDTDWDYGKIRIHQYNKGGIYTAKIEVKDTKGLTDYDAKTVTVEDAGGNSGTFIDSRDGQEYKYVKIGSQTWMAENLNYETSNSSCYDSSSSNCATYGRLYNWSAAMNACPPGWHLPSDNEWKILEGNVDTKFGVSNPEWNGNNYRGYDVGDRLKSTIGWYNNGNGSDAFGFAGLPGGTRDYKGDFFSRELSGLYWSSSEIGLNAWTRRLYALSDEVSRNFYYQENGFSVRCVKD